LLKSLQDRPPSLETCTPPPSTPAYSSDGLIGETTTPVAEDACSPSMLGDQLPPLSRLANSPNPAVPAKTRALFPGCTRTVDTGRLDRAALDQELPPLLVLITPLL